MLRRSSAPPPELIEFTVDDHRPVLAVMRRLLRDRDGWVNLQPAIDHEDVPSQGGMLGRAFSASGPAIPLATWMPGSLRRKGGTEPVSVGLQHAGGSRALRRLHEAGHPLVDGWRVLNDHPRRGFVLVVPDDEEPDIALTWLIRAANLLAPMELPPTWHAGVIRTR
jgi:hypothetical protein